MDAYRFFDHTGDFGVEVVVANRPAVLATVARAFLDLLTEATSTVREIEARELEVEGVDPADLLVAFGNELVFLFEAEGWLCARFDVAELEDTRACGTMYGEHYDPERHPIARPVKAVTHHGARFVETPDGPVEARLIFDL